MHTAGIDEVGRGCWAGPLVATAVVLNESIPGLQDSKTLSKNRREQLSELVLRQAAGYGIGWVWPSEIDQHGLTWAVKTAMERALNSLTVPIDAVVIDGNINYLPYLTNSTAVVKADGSIPEVSAASIIAKVTRDRYMELIAHHIYPEYEFNSHVGYGTKRHIALLQQYGVSPEHRYSYKPIQKMIGGLA